MIEKNEFSGTGLERPDNVFKPVILDLKLERDRGLYNDLIARELVSKTHNRIFEQLKELVKSRNPSVAFESETQYQDYIVAILQGVPEDEYGLWVYYPWNKSIVHVLPEDSFVELRTNRNRNKITLEEQQILKSKVVGIVGLSVGQSIALTMAMERVCGELRIADFDTVELSNLNRLRTSLSNLGLNKTIVAAREIAEIDPFIKIEIFNEGLTEDNLETFFTNGRKIDLLVEVCDSIEVKLMSRFKARALRIPVVMDTNDRGMIDIERFDLEPDRSIFHGKLDSFLTHSGTIDYNASNRSAIFGALVSYDSLSDRMKDSMGQIRKSITSWPQLASSVVLGGAITTDISRRILLDQHHNSGRFYVDLEQIIS